MRPGSSTLAVVINNTSERFEWDVEVVIPERVVLLGIEDLEERGRRVPTKVRAELVDFIEDEDGVLGLGSAQALDDLAWQRPDVGASMPADLGFVAHPTERDADVLPIERRRNRLGERGFPDARRTDETKDRPFDSLG